jgi:hypothetical protein
VITFADGPVQGQVLALHRAPVLLRVVVAPGGKVDALDQVEDEPAANETIHVYQREPRPVTMIHLNMGRSGGTGFYPMATYSYVGPVDDELVRATAAWRTWALSR